MSKYEFWALLIQGAIGLIMAGTLIFIWQQYRRSHQEFKARMRPYLGIEVFKQVRNIDPQKMDFEAYVGNSGNLPARNIEVSGKIKCEDEEVTFECPTKGVSFPSDKTEKWIMGISDIPISEISKGLKVLQVELKVKYSGPKDGAYWTTKNGYWDVQRKHLVNVEDNFN